MQNKDTENVKTTLLISTYNKPSWLRICLESVRWQVVLPYEVIICDDGSGEDTIQLIEELKRDFPVPIIHLWQPNRGSMGLATMRNKGIAASNGNYIIQTDGDEFFHPYFVKDHIFFCKQGYYLKGTRTYLGEKLSEKIRENGKAVNLSYWTTTDIQKRKTNLLRIPCLAKRLADSYRQNSSPGIGGNMSYWREDAIKINGYDEKFDGSWGKEDADFVARLMRLGIKKRYLKFAGNVFHLWHPTMSRDKLSDNLSLLAQNNEKGIIYIEKGVDQYLLQE